MRIQLLTCNRKPSYFRTTYRNMIAADPSITSEDVQIICHEPSSDYLLEQTGFAPWVSIRTLSEAQQKEKTALRLPKQRVVHANRFMLECAEDAGHFFYLEDDICFAPDWLTKFRIALAKFDNVDNIMLALHSHHPHAPGVVRWDPKTYWGLQGMFFGKNARKAALEWMQPNIKAEPTEAGDVRIKMMLLRRKDIQLWCYYPSLIQHVGYTTSIGSRYHLSPTFGQDE